MKKLTTFLAAALTAAVLLTGCGGQSAEKPDAQNDKKEPVLVKEDTIIVGTNAEFPPFEFVDDSGEFDGFDIAVMKEIGNRLDMDVEVSNMEFKSLIGAMEASQIDVIAAAMTVTDERKQSVDFTDSYYTARQYIVVQKDNDTIKQASDLNGRKIAVQEGTTGDFVASGDYDTIKDAQVKRFKKGADAIMDLKNGSVDAVIIDMNPAQEFVKANDDLKIVEDESATEEYAFAVQKGNSELAESINTCLEEMKKDGTFDSLIEKYINE